MSDMFLNVCFFIFKDFKKRIGISLAIVLFSWVCQLVQLPVWIICLAIYPLVKALEVIYSKLSDKWSSYRTKKMLKKYKV
jgi:hypothetical protein